MCCDFTNTNTVAIWLTTIIMLAAVYAAFIGVPGRQYTRRVAASSYTRHNMRPDARPAADIVTALRDARRDAARAAWQTVTSELRAIESDRKPVWAVEKTETGMSFTPVDVT